LSNYELLESSNLIIENVYKIRGRTPSLP
jgi:hypothetical protein